MTFGAPNLLSLMLLLPALAWLMALDLLRSRRAHQIAIPKARDKQLNTRSLQTKIIQHTTLWCAVAALLFASSRPQWGTAQTTTGTTRMSLIVALDLSPSMKKKDTAPSRWQRAVQEIQSFLQQLKGDRVALMTFDGEMGLQCPFTQDYTAIRELAWHHKPTRPPLPGQALSDMLRRAKQIIEKRTSKRAGRAMLLLSDGTSASPSLFPSARALKKSGTHLFVVGLGATSANQQQLRQLATAAGGDYIHVDAVGFGLQRVLSSLQFMQREEVKKQKSSQKTERFPIFLMLGIGFLLGNRLWPH